MTAPAPTPLWHHVAWIAARALERIEVIDLEMGREVE